MISFALKAASIAKRYGGNFAANIFQQGLRFIILYAAAKKLGPKEFGIFSILLLVSSYLMNANLGAVNGLKRQIPLIYAGIGERYSLHAFFSVLNFNLVATFLFALISSLILFRYYGFEPLAAIALLILSLSSNIYYSIQTFFTSTGNWNGLLRLQLLCGFFLSLALLSTIFADYKILVITYSLCFLLASLHFVFINGYRPAFDIKIIKENVKVGFPIMISGFIYLLFQSTDRLIVSYYHSNATFGSYSFAWVIVMSLNLVVSLSSEMILQKAATYFARVNSKKALFHYISRHSALFLIALAFIAFLLLVVIRYAIPIYFPEYIESIPVINNIVIAYVIQQTAMGVANYYYIIGRQLLYNMMLSLSCIFNAVILLLPFWRGALPTTGEISWLFIGTSCIYVVLMHLPLAGKSLRK